jgi:PPOX class probable F420-dependent enzyme
MAPIDIYSPGREILAFLEERHLATLSIVRADGTPHVTAVGFTYEAQAGLARVITWADSWKAKHVSRLGLAQAAICSVDGGRWLTLSGTASVTSDDAAVAEGVRRYAERYRQPKERPDRVVIELAVRSIVGRA